jgi:1-aminocyclopropane-1-carboxylate deaminase
VVCSVTGSTQAGMVAGVALSGRPRKVLGIDASAKPGETREQITRIAKATADLVGAPGIDEVLLDERYHAGVYGVPDESTLDAIRTAARLEGMITDPVYEGKSMAGLIDLVRTGEIPRDSNVLYAHLGGQPAINAYTSVLG